MKANLGSSLHHGLINGGFKESEASSKNYRDQLSRRLRNDRRAMEEGVLENDLVVNKLKGLWEKKMEEFLIETQMVTGSLTEVQATALGQFACEKVKVGLHGLAHQMQTQTQTPKLPMSSTPFAVPPSAAATAAATAAPTTPSPPPLSPAPSPTDEAIDDRSNGAMILSSISSQGKMMFPPAPSSRKRSIALAIPSVGGVQQEWTVLGQKKKVIQAPCVWDSHQRHTHQLGTCTEAHKVIKHCTPGAEPHVDFIIKDGDRTVIECYQNVTNKPDHDNFYSSICDCHSTLQNCDNHDYDLLPELLDPSLVDMGEFFDFDESEFLPNPNSK